MKRIRKITAALIDCINETLVDNSFVGMAEDYTPIEDISLPHVYVELVTRERSKNEIGSQKYRDNYLFAINIIGRTDGETSDITSVIVENCSKISISVPVSIGGYDYSNNLLYNGSFETLDRWNPEYAGIDNVGCSCIPLPDSCVFYTSCPWRHRRLSESQWFLSDEFSMCGNSICVFSEMAYATIACYSDSFLLDSGQYIVSGNMYKERNIEEMLIVIATGEDYEDYIAMTDTFSEESDMQEVTRNWVIKTKEFELEQQTEVFVILAASLKEPLYVDFGTPCVDSTHAAWDNLGIFKYEITESGTSDYVYINKIEPIVSDNIEYEHENVLLLEVID